MDNQQNQVEVLEDDYCPPLDTALFRAICNDYDLENSNQIDELRVTLDALKIDAEATQNDLDQVVAQSEPPNTVDASRNDAACLSLDTLSVTDPGLTSQAESSTQASDIPESYDEGIEELDITEKTTLLQGLCPGIALFDVQFTLRKNDGSFRKSLDELLNLVHIKETGLVSKGVDGFFQEPAAGRKRGKKKKNRSKDHSPESYSRNESHSIQNIWLAKTEQISWIAARVQLSETLIQSEFQKSGGSFHATILNLSKVEVNSKSGISRDDAVIQLHARDLKDNFPGLSMQESLGIVILTWPFPERAQELAKAAFAPSPGTSTPTSSATRIIPQYARLRLEEDDDDGVARPLTNLTQISGLTQHELAVNAARQAQRREEAFSKANAAWKKARSKPLMGGAAAYYGEESRNAHAESRAYSSAAADAQVRSTATGKSIDLHGVNVQDAVRNAREAVQTWWNSGQAEWARAGKTMGDDGFTVITGAGTHSVGGRAKIRPAVVKMLRGEGWRVEEDSDRGQIIVRGRVRVGR